MLAEKLDGTAILVHRQNLIIEVKRQSSSPKKGKKDKQPKVSKMVKKIMEATGVTWKQHKRHTNNQKKMTEELAHISVKCPFCSSSKVLHLSATALREWQAGKLVQEAFANLSADDRERLITGVCPECWEKTFNPG